MPHPVYRIFVSSTFIDLAHERAAVIAAIHDLAGILSRHRLALFPVDLRHGADSRSSLEVCLQEVRHSDLLISVIGTRYGYIDPTTALSMTRLEYEEAEKHKIGRLAYFRSERTLCLPEHIDVLPEKVRGLKEFKDKIDAELKRDVFVSPDDLKAKVMGDVMKWLLSSFQVTTALAASGPLDAIQDVRHLFDHIGNKDYTAAANVIATRRCEQDMRRFGMNELRVAMVRELLELETLLPPSKITDPVDRAKLLFDYVQETRHSPSRERAMRELIALEKTIADPAYSFELTIQRLKAATDGGDYGVADAQAKVLLKYAHTAGSFHVRAKAYRAIGDLYRAKGDPTRAIRWYWTCVRRLLTELNTCPHCISTVFVKLGLAEWSRGNCILAEDRFGKALMAARAIPSRRLQLDVLQYLAQLHLLHGRLKEAIAAYVWMARLVRETDPTEEAANIEILLGDVMIDYGREQVREILAKVEQDAEHIVITALAPFKIEGFAESLSLHGEEMADHW